MFRHKMGYLLSQDHLCIVSNFFGFQCSFIFPSVILISHLIQNGCICATEGCDHYDKDAAWKLKTKLDPGGIETFIGV